MKLKLIERKFARGPTELTGTRHYIVIDDGRTGTEVVAEILPGLGNLEIAKALVKNFPTGRVSQVSQQ